MERVSKFKYLKYVLDESGAGVTECCRKVAIRSLVNARGLYLEYAKVLHDTLHVLFCCMAVR